MTIPSTRSGQGCINALCLSYGIASPDSTQRATALAEINDAARTYYRGVYADERGNRLHHVWSWLLPKSTELTIAAQVNAYYTHGNVTFTAVDAEAAGEDVAIVVVAGAGLLSAAENTTTKIVTVTLATGGSTETAVVAACSALTLVTVTGSGATNMAALAHTHLAQSIVGTACPSDFAGIVSEPIFRYDHQDPKAGLKIDFVSPEEMDRLTRDWDGSTADQPTSWCLRDKALSTTLGSLKEICFFPPPAAALILNLRFRPDPGDITDSASVYLPGSMGCEQLVLALARAAKERDGGQVLGVQNQNANRLFADLVLEDISLYPTREVQESTASEDDGMLDDV